MSNDTREALAARCKRLVDDMHIARLDTYDALCAAIDELAAAPAAAAPAQEPEQPPVDDTRDRDIVRAALHAFAYDRRRNMAARERAAQIAMRVAEPSPAPAVQPLALLHCGALFGDEQADWELEADSQERIDAYCAARPGQTVALYPGAPAVQPTEAVAELVEALLRVLRYFPTDDDLREAGWRSEDVTRACDAYDHAKAVHAKHRQPHGAGQPLRRMATAGQPQGGQR